MNDDIESSVHAAIQAGQINGAIICATDAEGGFTYEKALGERILLSGERQPQQLNDVLYLASATKLLASVAALQCVDDGLLTLKGDLSSIAPELAGLKILNWTGTDSDTPKLEPQARPITLEMLLTHSSGLSYDFLVPRIAQWRKQFGPLQNDERRPVEESFNYPLGFQPGSGWMYGPGLDWAGRIVERVTGISLGERMRQRIFEPLGITDAQFYPVTREDLRQRLVDLNPQDPEGFGRAVVGGSGDMHKRTLGDFGGHGLYMTAPDYVKVLHSVLANDGKILKSSTVDDMFENHLSPEAIAGHEAALASPLGVFFRVGIEPNTKLGYGLGGLITLESVPGWYGERTLSWGGGLTFTWFIDRQNGLCGVGAVQAALPVDGDAIDAIKHVFRHDIYRKHASWKEKGAGTKK